MPRKIIKFDLDFSVKDILPKFKVKQYDDVILNITSLYLHNIYPWGEEEIIVLLVSPERAWLLSAK